MLIEEMLRKTFEGMANWRRSSDAEEVMRG